MGYIPTSICLIAALSKTNKASKHRKQPLGIPPSLPPPTPHPPPPPGSLKLNTDGAAKGKPGPAGIGGVLRDHLGFIKVAFSNHIGIEESNYAAFQAIQEGIRFFSHHEPHPMSWKWKVVLPMPSAGLKTTTRSGA
ncbi:Uncharacterized protein TCM_022064 [Theobroma cacao]|uniref:RNase H type-1 domain-containing protein n=1 Tax=Theobroma cacao TaxID=3641 RepID=A0A061ETJ6_THECC|nr:Uncharacterized protein TCM_022064 [Theobroma cacao]